jgi:hypothetical protein
VGSGFLLERDDKSGHVVEQRPRIAARVHAGLDQPSLFFQIRLFGCRVRHAKIGQFGKQNRPATDEGS